VATNEPSPPSTSPVVSPLKSTRRTA